MLILSLLGAGSQVYSAPAPASEEAPPPQAVPGEDTSITWVDTTHAYATNQAQALTEWMDDFFGDQNYDLERPESLLRLEWGNTWDQEDGSKSRLRLRGKLQLPALSERLNLVFSGDDGDTLEEDERDSVDDVGVFYKLGERTRSRVDLTLGVDWGELTPGVRYRNQGPVGDLYRYRFTQRLEYESDEGLHSTSELNLDHALAENKLLRWGSRAIYGEETEGVEWRTRLAVRQRFETPTLHDPFVFSYFATVKGVSDPNYIKNYRFGILFRRQVFRRYFFAEIEPSYNLRKREGESRDGVWNVTLRFEILLEPDRRRTAAVLARERELLMEADEGADEVADHPGRESGDGTVPSQVCTAATDSTC